QIKGTIKFYDPNPDKIPETLLGMLASKLYGTWKIGHVDVELMNLYRTFDVLDQSLYNFMMTDLEQSYGCIFKFDTFNRTINAYTPENAVTNTDIYLSYDNLIKKISIATQEEQLCTALEILGGSGLDIRQVNPLGTNFIYDFSYFMTRGYMSEGLVIAITNWQTKVDGYQTTYSTKLTELKSLQSQLLSAKTSLTEYESDLASLKQGQSIAIDAGNASEITRLNGLIKQKEAQITTQKQTVASLETQVKNKTDELKAINKDVSFPNNFTSQQLGELGYFIKEQSYQEPNLIKTPEMTDEQVLDNSLELYRMGKYSLKKLSRARYTFDVDLVNFLAIPQFQKFITQLQLGAKLLVDVDTGFDIFPKVEKKLTEYIDKQLTEIIDQNLIDLLFEAQSFIEP
ncbi:MAG: phage tail protein, partial [Bacteroidales bacterium]